MTKAELILEVTKRLGDPTAVAFGDRVWSYLVETLYELFEALSPTEQINTTRKDIGYVDTNISGVAKPIPATKPIWTGIYGVNINGVPARQVDQKEYAMMLENSFYAPAEDEYCYYFDGEQLVILTGLIAESIRYEVNYKIDPTTELGTIESDDQIPMPNSLVAKAIPLVVAKVKAEVGLLL